MECENQGQGTAPTPAANDARRLSEGHTQATGAGRLALPRSACERPIETKLWSEADRRERPRLFDETPKQRRPSNYQPESLDRDPAPPGFSELRGFGVLAQLAEEPGTGEPKVAVDRGLGDAQCFRDLLVAKSAEVVQLDGLAETCLLGT